MKKNILLILHDLRSLLLYVLILLSSETLFGQTTKLAGMGYQSDPTIFSVPTPQAASLGKFGRVPVDLFNGLYDLTIPLYTLPVKGHPMDIKLSYHSGGVKPTEKGGTVGVGWSLMATGSITRIQNGTLDEHVNTAYTDSLLGYYWNRSQLNVANWDSASSMINFLNELSADGSGTYPQWHDWAPDEFLFNFFGYSGSFWLDNNGTWQIRENSGEKLTLSVSLGPYTYQYPSATNSVTVKYCFQNFNITDGYGNTFTFGSDANSIEFNRNSPSDVWPSTATSWYLTQVKTAKGEKVTFSYTRPAYSYSINGSMNAYQAQLASNIYSTYSLQNLSGIIHDPVYLSNIICKNISIQFTYSPSNIYYYSSSTTLNANGTPSGDNTVPSYYSSTRGATLPSQEVQVQPPVNYKLDQIFITYGSYNKRYNFTYYDSSVANRLFLKTCSIGPPSRALIYQFSYNGTKFSNYADGKIEDGILTTKVDHWGYYNGKFPFKTSDLPALNGQYYNAWSSNSSAAYPNDDFITNYYANRRPVSDSMKVGALSQVIYPTGGYTNFIYEPHTYSSQINLANYLTTSLGADSTAGGLRIKEIDSYSDPNSTPFVKKYIYKNENGYSSGVLNTAGILYKDSANATGSSGTLILKYFSDNNLLPLQNSNGNHVTYSRVTEIDSDSGRTVYRYANHDNGHGDITPEAFVSATLSASYYRQPLSRNFQRGKLLAQTAYDSSNTVVSRDTINYFNDDSLTSNRVGVRAYCFKSKDIKMMNFATSAVNTFQQAFVWVPNVSPYVYYKHFYPTIQKSTTYFKGPDSLKTVETYQYNPNNNKISIDSLKNLSDNSVKITTYNYPSDYGSNSFYTGMTSLNVIDPVIKQTLSNQSGKALQVVKDSLKANTFNSTNYYWLFERDVYQVSTDVTKMNILKYDSVGNQVDAVGADGIPVTTIWDYAAMHPIAFVKNANSAAAAYTSFEADGTGHWKVPDTIRNLSGMTGIQSYGITNSKTITDSVPAGTQYIVSYWAKSGPAVVKANGTVIGSSLTGMTKSGWTYYEHLLPSTTVAVSVTGASASTTYIDELRLYPFGAQMTTYTYSPLCGVTSITSPSNNITYYIWDDPLERLLRIQDMDGNIVKQYDYTYQRLIYPAYSTAQSGIFTRSNCGTGYIGGTYTYTVPAGKYRSYNGIADANQLALNEIAANGQHFADSLGTCYIQISINNIGSIAGFTAVYTNLNNTSIHYSFSLPTTNGNVGLLPAGLGNWKLVISKSGNTTSYTFDSGCGVNPVYGTSATFSSVAVSTTNCNTILLSNRPF